MDYELFKKLVPARIKDFMTADFRDYQVRVNPVPKVNGVKDAICMVPPEQGTDVALPTLYLNDLYEEFKVCEDLDEILMLVAQVFMQWSGVEIPELTEFRLEKNTDSIAANLISGDLNGELKKKVPYREFMDMIIIYRMVREIDENGISSAVITNEILEGSGLTEEDLYRHAMENTPRLFPARIITTEEKKMCAMTNASGICGATTMLYEKDLQRLAGQLGGDYFIIPSSIHEFLAVATRDADPEALTCLLAEGNQTITAREELLSFAVYRYLAKEGRIVNAVV